MALRLLAALPALVALTSATGTAPAADAPATPPTTAAPAKKEKPTPIEARPYKIRAWVAVAPTTRLDYRGREALIAGWRTLIERFVGPPWQVEVADGDGPLLANGLEELMPEAVAPLAQGFDKAWVIQVRPLPGGYGILLNGREWDAATGQIGLVGTKPARSIADAPRALLGLALDIFAPTAEIGKKVGGGVMIQVQGSLLPAADPVGRVVQEGSVFKVARIAYKPDGSIARVAIIPRTYLRVARIEDVSAYCDIITKLRDPFTRMVVGRYKVVAVGVKPTGVPTRLHFVTPAPENRPLAGYSLELRQAPDGPRRIIAITDREGRVELEPYFATNLVLIRLLAANVEPLDEFPIMPGETDEERTIVVRPKVDAVTLVTELHALRDAIIDQVSLRARLDAMIKPRVEGELWDEVLILLDEYEKYPKRIVFQQRLEELKQAAAERQKEINKPVLTRTAQLLIADTSALIERYLDDEMFAAYADAYDRYAATAPPEKARKRTLPTGRAEDALANLATPSAASSGQEETRAGLIEFLPKGLGIRVAMPGHPTETASKETTSNGPVNRRTFTIADPKRGTYQLTILEREKPIQGERETREALDTGRLEGMLAAEGSKKFLVDRELTLEGRYPGRESEFEYRPQKEGVLHRGRVRTFVVGKRIYTLRVMGTEAQVRTRIAELFLDSFRLLQPPAGPQANATASRTNR